MVFLALHNYLSPLDIKISTPRVLRQNLLDPLPGSVSSKEKVVLPHQNGKQDFIRILSTEDLNMLLPNSKLAGSR